MSELAKRKKWFERNERAEELEAEGKTAEALALYEQNASEGCDVAYTYERMAGLYRLQERHDDEVKALERALSIEQERGPSAQVLRLTSRIETAKEFRERRGSRPAPARGEPSEAPVRRKVIQKKKKKGCLGVLVLMASASLLLFSLAIA